MLFVLLVLCALLLLLVIVYGLRRYQLRENETNADRQSPLPPLDLSAVAPLEDDEAPALQKPLAASPSFDEKSFAQDVVGHDVDNLGFSASAVEASPVSSAAKAPALPVINASWLQDCNRLKSEGRYEDALEACETAMPQWGAFSQAATILRAQIRDSQKKAEDIAPLLDDLYLVATYASLLHDKQGDLPSLTPHQIKQLPDSAWQSLEMPYSRIGYKNLRLLTKSDAKLIREHWGEPEQHQSPRILHESNWLRIVQIYGS